MKSSQVDNQITLNIKNHEINFIPEVAYIFRNNFN